MVLTELEKKERRREANRKSYHKHKEKLNERRRESYNKNKEKEAERNKAYNQTEQGKKSNRINNWKHKGIICENFDDLYDYVINCKNCENCGIELTVDKRRTATTRCLDHCHETGEFRDVLCHSCNIKRR